MTALNIGPFRLPASRHNLPTHISRFLPPGANLVRTRELNRLITLAPRVLARPRIVVIDGDPGCGKSTALGALVAGASVAVASITVAPATTGRRFMNDVHTAVTGQAASRTQTTVENALKHLLTQQTRILAFDEAQNASPDVLKSLRLIMEAPGAQFAVVLAGSGIVKHLARDEMLHSWVGLTVICPRLNDRAILIAQLTELHPSFGRTRPALLEEVNRVWAHGRLRNWCVLLEWLLTFTSAGAPFDKPMFLDALEAVTGARPMLDA